MNSRWPCARPGRWWSGKRSGAGYVVSTLSLVDPTVEAVLGGVLGLGNRAVTGGSGRLSDRSQRSVPQPSDPHALPPGVSAVLAVLRSGAIVLDAADAVVSTSPWAVAHADGDPAAAQRTSGQIELDLLDLAVASDLSGQVAQLVVDQVVVAD